MIYNKITFYKAAIISATMFAFSACNSSDNTSDEPTSVTYSWTETSAQQAEFTVLRADTIPSALLLNLLMGQDVQVPGSVVVRNISYNATAGEKAHQLSGVVALPAGIDEVHTIIIGNHWTIGSDAECPSKSLPIDVGLSVTRGAMVVCADYLGYGLTADEVHPYLCAIETARNSVDCFKAAIALCQSLGIKLADDYRTYNIGYSQGGAVALAVQRYIESNASVDSLVRLEKTLCGAGPYDPIACYKEYLNSDTLAYPVVVPMIIAGMKATYPEILQDVAEADFFSEKFNAAGILDSVKSKKYNTLQLNSLITRSVDGATPQNIFSAASLDTTSAIAQKLSAALEINNLTKGWQPQHRVQFFHSTVDVVVPIINTQNALKAFGESTTDKAIIDNMGTHNDAALLFYKLVLQNNIFE